MSSFCPCFNICSYEELKFCIWNNFISYISSIQARSVIFFWWVICTFDLKIITPDESNNVNKSVKGKITLSWTNLTPGENTIQIQNTGNSEFQVSGTFELERDPLFFTYSILVIVAGIVIIGFSAGFSVRKPKGF